MLPFIAIDYLGIRLHQIRDEDLEIVFQGRNKDFVRRNHFHQEKITEVEHNAWYKQICAARDYYFVVSKDNERVGLVYLKDIKPNFKSGHTGIFFWNEKILHTKVPLKTALAFTDLFFSAASLERMEAIVRKDNMAMLNIFDFFRFEKTFSATEEKVYLFCKHASYMEERARLLHFSQRINRDEASWVLRIEGEKDERHHPEILRLIP
ncbi:MAG: hypothetical protein LDLANPLL_01003 [Turneriella sp.]|nr:hypothetical protein [Turneriella sp.]